MAQSVFRLSKVARIFGASFQGRRSGRFQPVLSVDAHLHPDVASFKGYGANAKADPVFAQADEAARVLYEKIGDKVKFQDMDLIGQEFCIVLEKI